MPVDMALPVYRSNEDFIYRSLPRTCRPALRFGTDQTENRRSNKKAKKQVTFADHRGMSLTKVKHFSALSDPINVPLNIQEMLSSAFPLTAEDDKLVLDFPQPSSDYLRFRQSLETNCVSLEHCVLKGEALEGTVKVKNVSFEKSVTLRVTFDTWRSHADVECVYMRDSYTSANRDTFSFHVSLPDRLQLHQHIEFAVCYQVGGCQYWDSNHGDNYRIVWSSMRGRSHHTDSGIHVDRYGSPTCSHGILPDWPSYACFDTSTPYY